MDEQHDVMETINVVEDEQHDNNANKLTVVMSFCRLTLPMEKTFGISMPVISSSMKMAVSGNWLDIQARALSCSSTDSVPRTTMPTSFLATWSRSSSSLILAARDGRMERRRQLRHPGKVTQLDMRAH